MRDNSTGLIEVESRLNVAADGKRFRCDFMREGPVYYPEHSGIEVVRRETILAGLNSFIGKPLTLEHIDPRLNVADPVVFAKHAHGKVDEVGFDKDTGWFFCGGDVTTDKARENAGTMNPSCAFNILSSGKGGRWNNLPYNKELTGIEFHHLALTTKRARFEEADFRLNCVQNPDNKTMKLTFLRTIVAAIAGGQPTTEEVEINADAKVSLPGGGEARLNDVVTAFTDKQTADAAAAAEAEKKKNASESRVNSITDVNAVVMIDGKPVKVSELTAAYESRQNAAAAEKTRVETESRENAAKGAADFNKLQNAAAVGAGNRSDFPKTGGGKEESLKRGVY